MAIYEKEEFIKGKWTNKKEIHEKQIKDAKIVSETNPEPSQFTNDKGEIQMQDVCKVLFAGINEPLKLSLNRPTINGLVDAFGNNSRDWTNKPLKVETEKIRAAGRAGIVLYLIPEGYEKIDDDEGYARIVKYTGDIENKVDNNNQEGIKTLDDLPF